MKTRITEKIITETSGISFGYWDENEEEFIKVEATDEIILAAQKLNASPELIAALVSLVDLMVCNIGDDLADIWKRLDKIEARL